MSIGSTKVVVTYQDTELDGMAFGLIKEQYYWLLKQWSFEKEGNLEDVESVECMQS